MPVIRGSMVRIINETSGRDIPLSLFGVICNCGWNSVLEINQLLSGKAIVRKKPTYLKIHLNLNSNTPFLDT